MLRLRRECCERYERSSFYIIRVRGDDDGRDVGARASLEGHEEEKDLQFDVHGLSTARTRETDEGVLCEKK